VTIQHLNAACPKERNCRINGATSLACDRRVLDRNGMVPAPATDPVPIEWDGLVA
jgi:hypothetical protein